MKTLVNLIALCFVVTMIGCQTTQTADVSPGAISGAECTAHKDKAECERLKTECHHEKKAECEKAREADASFGAVSEEKECEKAKKAECEKARKAECHHQKN